MTVDYSTNCKPIELIDETFNGTSKRQFEKKDISEDLSCTTYIFKHQKQFSNIFLILPLEISIE